MQVYGLFITAANGLPLLSFINDEISEEVSPLPIQWSEESNKLIGGFISAMNLFCEELVQKVNDTMRVSIDGLSLTTIARSIDLNSAGSGFPGQNWLDRLIFVLLHSETSSRASEYLLQILVEQFFQVYERTWLSQLVSEGRVVFPDKADSAHFYEMYKETIHRFKITRDINHIDVEYEL